MLDIRELRKNFSHFEKNLRSKDPKISLTPLIELDRSIRETKTRVEQLKAKRNDLSKEIGQRKKERIDSSDLMSSVSDIGKEIAQLDETLKELEKKFNETILYLPNLIQEEVPISLDSKNNVCIKIVGEKPSFSFPFKTHLELSEDLSLFDFTRGSKISGSGFTVYHGLGAQLEWALLNYMLDIHQKNGFTFVLPPLLAKQEIMLGSAQLPKFEDQLFKIHDEDFHLYLIPTAEAALNGLHYDEIIDETQLPLTYVSYTPCFRREAGAAGKKERGLIRTHQFNKVELFALTTAEDSNAMLETLITSAEEVLNGLELHYRNMLCVSSDTSFASSKTIDIEVWLPGQDRYYEVSSVSHCTDFQARRSKIRYRAKNQKPEFVHTLNGSGVATSRLMVSLLETHQQKDGTIRIPKALLPYLEKSGKQLTSHGT